MNNPVLWLELRVRIRERKLWIVTCLYLLCLCTISCIALTMASQEEAVDFNPADTGMTIFGFGIFSLVGLLVILGPLASAGSISQEREQRTMPALLNTPMSPFNIVAGKLLAAWAFVLWLALLSVPFIGLGMVWGAVTAMDTLEGLALAVAAGFVSSAIAIGLSGYFRRSLTSYLTTGAVMFFWLIVWPIFGWLALIMTMHQSSDVDPMTKHWLLFSIFFYHHPITPLICLMTKLGRANPPEWIIPYALGVWVVLGSLFFLLACRGLRRSAVGKN